MNPDTASLQECCDALAEFAGYTRHEPPGGGDYWWTHESSSDPIYEPPFSDLDSIAGALPAGWVWNDITWLPDEVYAGARSGWDVSKGIVGVDGEADTELLARARAAVKAWLAVKGKQ